MSGKRKKKVAVWSVIVLVVAIIVTLVAMKAAGKKQEVDRKSTRLNSSHCTPSRMPSSA